MCTETCNHQNFRNMEVFVVWTLVPLDKNLGVKPIEICEVLCRIFEKGVMNEIKSDGTLCWPIGWCIAAVHVTMKIFHNDEIKAVLLVDASNAFNPLNRSVMLHNINLVFKPRQVCWELIYTKNVCDWRKRVFFDGGYCIKRSNLGTLWSVSYTHLTLPTILLV